MKIAFLITPWIILLVPFIILVFLYDSIEEQVLLMRSFAGNQTVYAPKSIFTVFRVPLIEVVCALAIETVRAKFSHSKPNAGFTMWSILLYTAAFKSLFQVFEFISLSVYHSPDYAGLFFYATLLTVVAGICLAIIKGRKIFSSSSRSDWKTSFKEKIFLTVLLAAYFILAMVPTFIFKSD
jgi:hypothetical protein